MKVDAQGKHTANAWLFQAPVVVRSADSSLSPSPSDIALETGMRQRIKWIDAVKGFLTALVVLGHSIQWNAENPFETFGFKAIYSFHMPMFFFVSGYLSFSSDDSWHKWRAKMAGLLTPFFSWAILRLVVRLCTGTLQSGECLSEIVRLCIRPDRGLWFLWVLSCCITVRYCICALRRYAAFEWLLHVFVATLLMLCVVATGYNRYAVHLVALYYPYYIAGHYVRRSKNIWTSKRLIVAFIAGSILYVAGLPFWTWRGDMMVCGLVLKGGLLAQAYKTIVASAAVAASFTGTKLIEGRLSHLPGLAWLGRASLGIYGAHYLFLQGIGNWLKCVAEIERIVLVFVGVLLLSCGVVVIFRLNRLSRYLFLGGR